MPQITVYIKDEDMPLWKALPHKAEAIRNMLRMYQDITKKPSSSHDEIGYPQPSSTLVELESPSKKVVKLCKIHRMEKQYCALMKH